uniref:Protein-serine/threonine phosphatase n=1 Tax=Globodera pallida TaxID=36090 RepID=A0A183BKL6_GLOPA
MPCSSFVLHSLLLHSLILLLLAFLFSSVQCLTPNRQKLSQSNTKDEDRNLEKALNRTLAKLNTDGEHRRFVLLVCRGKCLKERAQIPNWLREFNTANNASILKRIGDYNNASEVEGIAYDGSHFEGIGFHYHLHRRPIPVMGIEQALKEHSFRQSVLFYVVGGMAFPATPEEVYRQKISELVEMNEWLNSECHGNGLNRRRLEQEMVLLVVHDQFVCPESLLPNFARSLFASSRHSRTNITVLEAVRPLGDSEELSLYARLPGLSCSCRVDILLRANLFTELPQGVLGSNIHQIIENWIKLPLANERCPEGNSSLNLAPVLGPLGAANLEFLREERILRAIERKREYLTVGIIGGVAVMALAMSIFWGLNGNDFISKP